MDNLIVYIRAYISDQVHRDKGLSWTAIFDFFQSLNIPIISVLKLLVTSNVCCRLAFQTLLLF